MSGKAGSISPRGTQAMRDASPAASERTRDGAAAAFSDETQAGETGRADAAYRFLRNAILSNELPAGFQVVIFVRQVMLIGPNHADIGIGFGKFAFYHNCAAQHGRKAYAHGVA